MLRTMTARSIGLLVDQAMELRLRRAVPTVPFTLLSDALELAFFDLESSPAAFIVDPGLLSIRDRQELLPRLGERRSVPVILYARMTPELASVLLEMGKAGIRHVMFYNLDDDPKGVRAVLASAVLHARRQ